jgi:hypothetical protein
MRRVVLIAAPTSCGTGGDHGGERKLAAARAGVLTALPALAWRDGAYSARAK